MLYSQTLKSDKTKKPHDRSAAFLYEQILVKWKKNDTAYQLGNTKVNIKLINANNIK